MPNHSTPLGSLSRRAVGADKRINKVLGFDLSGTNLGWAGENLVAGHLRLSTAPVRLLQFKSNVLSQIEGRFATTEMSADLNKTMFKTKICGVTNVVDANKVLKCGGDAIGLNFYLQSCRYVESEVAAEISRHIGTQADVVGVFVNNTADQINDISEKCRLGWVQLHGDEPPELLSGISAQRKIIRAYRITVNASAVVPEDLAACDAAGRLPDAILFDAAATGQYGGTGEGIREELLTGYRDWIYGLPVILAGGLNPENVGAAISNYVPDAVDVASGVESAAGIKDEQAISRFLQMARDGFGVR